MNKLPLAKNKDIVMQELGKELLIYDLMLNKAFCLNETSASVFQYCDGKTSFSELKAKTSFTDDIIFLAIDELKKNELLENAETLISPLDGLSRREVIRKAGLTSMIALPVVAGLMAPSAAQAQSCTGLGRQDSGELITGGGSVFCSPNQSACDSAAVANPGGCCSGSATLVPNNTDCGGSDPPFACQCN